MRFWKQQPKPEVESATAVGVAVAAEEPEEPLVPVATPARQPRLGAEELAEYQRVSEEVGVACNNDLTRERLLHCLRDENIHVYNGDEVIAYLDAKLGPTWEWRGLRQVDVDQLKGWSIDKTDAHRKVCFSDEPYRAAVPLPVLLTVQKILAAAPDVHFYVSAPKVMAGDPDPFLYVTTRHFGGYVVERWDEPGFRERTAAK
jgi:hypothetical protein